MTQAYRHGAADLARMLAARAPALAAEILPAGKREGQEWIAGSLHGEKGRSLSVRLTGDRAGVWADFASGEKGDALDLVRLALYGGDRVQAMIWARRWLGLGEDGVGTVDTIRRAAPPVAAAPDPEALRRRRQSLALFLEAEAVIRGTPVEAYLTNRSIPMAELGRQPRALRFHPACWCAERRGPLPAMLGAITSAEGEHLATHRTYLEECSGAWRKAALQTAKKVLGGYAGGFIPIWRGAFGRSMREAEEGETVVIAEGIETALSCAVLTPELRVIAAVSLSNLGRLVLPSALSRITIAADDDAPESPAARALQSAIDRFAAEGRAVHVARWAGGDFNDALAGARA